MKILKKESRKQKRKEKGEVKKKKERVQNGHPSEWMSVAPSHEGGD